MPSGSDIHAEAVTLLELLQGDQEYHAPLFQRQYVWADSDIERLWGDIRGLLDGEERIRFLGAIVLEERHRPAPTDPHSYWIIDGQQRLTTLYLLLCALTTLASVYGDIDTADEVRSRLLNQHGKRRNEPKLRPTVPDITQFNQILRSVPDTEPKLTPDQGPKSGRMTDAYQLVQDKLREYCAPDGQYDASRSQAIVNVVGGAVKLVHIVLASGAPIDPNQVFDTLNTAGQRLENSDLVRNEIFKGLARDPEKASHLYHNKWRFVEERLGVRLNRYFFPFTLIHDPKATKSAVLQTLRARWEGWEAELIIEDISEFLDAFDLCTREDAGGAFAGQNPMTSVACARLVRLGPPDSVLPLVVRAVHSVSRGQTSDHAGAELVGMVETFLVRRGFVGLEPTGLHVVFKDLWARCEGSATKAKAYIEGLGTVAFPGDEEFGRAIEEAPLYRRKSIVNHVLWEFEIGAPGDPLPTGIALTVDHVVPQVIRDTAWASSFSDKDHERLVHTWGNLVPLSKKLNSKKARKDWPSMRGVLQTENAFKTTRHLALKHSKWTKTEIAGRAKDLRVWALARWPASFTS